MNNRENEYFNKRENLGDLSKYPQELKEQLKLQKDLSQQCKDMLLVINKFSGYVTLNKIIIEYYKKFKVIKHRASLSIFLYQMWKNGLIEKHSHRVTTYKRLTKWK